MRRKKKVSEVLEQKFKNNDKYFISLELTKIFCKNKHPYQN